MTQKQVIEIKQVYRENDEDTRLFSLGGILNVFEIKQRMDEETTRLGYFYVGGSGGLRCYGPLASLQRRIPEGYSIEPWADNSTFRDLGLEIGNPERLAMLRSTAAGEVSNFRLVGSDDSLDHVIPGKTAANVTYMVRGSHVLNTKYNNEYLIASGDRDPMWNLTYKDRRDGESYGKCTLRKDKWVELRDLAHEDPEEARSTGVLLVKSDPAINRVTLVTKKDHKVEFTDFIYKDGSVWTRPPIFPLTEYAPLRFLLGDTLEMYKEWLAENYCNEVDHVYYPVRITDDRQPELCRVQPLTMGSVRWGRRNEYAHPGYRQAFSTCTSPFSAGGNLHLFGYMERDVVKEKSLEGRLLPAYSSHSLSAGEQEGGSLPEKRAPLLLPAHNGNRSGNEN